MVSYQLADIVLMRAITPLHPGVGRGGELVDLAVQRDGLGFPIVYSSSIKGAMKSSIADRRRAALLFGPEAEEEEKFAAPVAVLDAYFLAFPVRSLVGVYGYATAPVLLRRAGDYLNLAKSVRQRWKGSPIQPGGVGTEGLDEGIAAVEKLSTVPVEKGKVCVVKKEGFIVEGLRKIVVNEELWLDPLPDGDVNENLRKLAKALALEEEKLMLLSDEDALRAVEKSLVRVTRVRLQRETKTVAGGGLWTEEYVPREAIFCTAILYSEAKAPQAADAMAIREMLVSEMGARGNYLVIGGHETIGRGVVKLKFLW